MATDREHLLPAEQALPTPLPPSSLPPVTRLDSSTSLLDPTIPKSFSNQAEPDSPPKPSLPTSISHLPVEVVAIIFGWLPNFCSLLDAITACKYLYNSYETCSKKIVVAIYQECNRIEDLLWELEFLTRHGFVTIDDTRYGFVRADDTRAALDLAWPFFKDRQWEELLLPLARRLARTYRKDCRLADTVTFLEKIWYDDKQLFNPPNLGELQRLPTLIPFGEMLAELTIDHQRREQILADIKSLKLYYQRTPRRRASTVEIRRDEITLCLCPNMVWEMPGKTPGETYILEPGMYHIGDPLSRDPQNCDLALATVYNPPGLPYTALITEHQLQLNSTYQETPQRKEIPLTIQRRLDAARFLPPPMRDNKRAKAHRLGALLPTAGDGAGQHNPSGVGILEPRPVVYTFRRGMNESESESEWESESDRADDDDMPDLEDG